MRRRIGGLIAAAGNAYAASLLGFLLLRSTPLREMWWLRLGADFLPLLFVPSLALAPMVLILSRSRLAKILACVPWLVFALCYGPLFVPRPAPASAGAEATLSVMTYNVTRNDPGVDNILDILRSEGADVVALQEVTPQLAEALSALSEDYPHMALHPTPDGYSGCGVLSRYPITADEAFPLVEGMHLYQRVVLEVEGSTFHLLNVHLQPPRLSGDWWGHAGVFVPLGYDTSTQDAELERLLGIVDSLRGRVIVAGDLNMTEESAGYREVTRGLVDAYRKAGWGLGLTFPDQEFRSVPIPFPLLRIDYVFHSPDMATVSARVGDRGGPDHRYVVAELAF